ncbi:hypothetical protein TNCT_703651 [Trichonephila clavata]|uniref:Uncharacterized protein n=1 Tax=Trichonephila clavata TaxID=2740835 RepID=A0A8X6KFE1_TRICU|nr:hypothetical protein TNCT_176871 [Trichonephila clavata]GFQ74435.1 hypothetical protein TNCT_77931 [Trichonephila clavata]GFQ85421.1 hypothetical protein TNCT_435591 [Trichonephila clavata]GFQ86571.1 hypothetical protein TNCT_445391 [Trichonephila clavata]GFQ93388.1 hypothetical protein TNCT_556131 [Trichonephila clavata]
MSTTKSSPPKTTEEPIDLSTPKMSGFNISEKRPSFHPYRLEKDDDVVCLREKIHNTEGEYSAASPPYTPSSPTYPPSSPSLPDIYRSTPMPKTPTPDVRASFPNYNLPDVRASFPNYNLIKTYFSSNFVQYIPQNDFGMGFPKYITYKMGNRKMTYYAVNKNN